MGAGWATFTGAVGDNREHAHHALQLVVGETADVAVWIRGRGEVQAPAVLLDADVVHRVHPGPGGQLLMAAALLKAWNAPALVSGSA